MKRSLAGTNVRSIAISVFVLIIVSMFTLDLYAQVHIRERVEIGGTGQNTGPLIGPSSPHTTDSFFVAPRPGVLAIVPIQAKKLGAPFPNEAYLEVRLSDTTYTPALSSLLPCTSFQSVYWFTCGIYTSGTQYYRNQYQCAGSDTFYTRRLQAGDTVRFAFQGEFYNTTSSISFGWDYNVLELSTPIPPGCQEPHSPPERLRAYFYLILWSRLSDRIRRLCIRLIKSTTTQRE